MAKVATFDRDEYIGGLDRSDAVKNALHYAQNVLLFHHSDIVFGDGFSG
jgi:hypothetical protein